MKNNQNQREFTRTKSQTKKTEHKTSSVKPTMKKAGKSNPDWDEEEENIPDIRAEDLDLNFDDEDEEF